MSEQQSTYSGTPAKPSTDLLAGFLDLQSGVMTKVHTEPGMSMTEQECGLMIATKLKESAALLREQARRLAAVEALAKRMEQAMQDAPIIGANKALDLAFGQLAADHDRLRAALGK